MKRFIEWWFLGGSSEKSLLFAMIRSGLSFSAVSLAVLVMVYPNYLTWPAIIGDAFIAFLIGAVYTIWHTPEDEREE